jgi:soluble lytic murein transglycosylase-like protein
MSLRSTLIFGVLLLFGAAWSYETAKHGDRTLDLSKVSLKKAPPCIRLYDYLQTYSKQYNVPFNIAMGVAETESGYHGPFDWGYNPKLVSSAHAYGAMQIQVPTATATWGKQITSKQLLNDLELNVKISMKLLSNLYKKYGDWGLVLGCYNTGRPMINGYALKILNRQ